MEIITEASKVLPTQIAYGECFMFNGQMFMRVWPRGEFSETEDWPVCVVSLETGKLDRLHATSHCTPMKVVLVTPDCLKEDIRKEYERR